MSGSNNGSDKSVGDEHFMREALVEAGKAYALGEVPVGAVLVVNGEIVGRGYNQPITALDATAHAEVMALRDACKRVGNYRLVDAVLYVTVEPCTMCAGSLVHARVQRLVYGATEPKAGVIDSQAQLLQAPFLNHQVAVSGGVLAQECRALMQQFFAERRSAQKSRARAGENKS